MQGYEYTYDHKRLFLRVAFSSSPVENFTRFIFLQVLIIIIIILYTGEELKAKRGNKYDFTAECILLMFPRCANMALDQVGKLEAAWYKISHVTVLAVFRFHLFLNLLNSL